MSFKDYKLLTCLILLMVSSLIWGLDSWTREYTPLKMEYIEGMGWMEFDVYYSLEDVLIAQDGGYIVSGSVMRDIPDTPPVYWDHWGFVMKTDFEGNVLWADADSVSFMDWNDNYAIVETDEGDIISVVYSYFDGCMIKRNCDGERLWSIEYNDFGSISIINTSDNDLMMGSFENNNIAMRKMDYEGNTLWTKSFDYDRITYLTSIFQTDEGDYICSGVITNNDEPDSMIVIKADDNGDSLWTNIYGVNWGDSRSTSIIETNNGEILISGYIRSDTIRNYHGLLIKLDSYGNYIWDQLYSDYDIHYLYSIINSNDNNYIAYGGDYIAEIDNQNDIIWIEETTGLYPAEGDRCIQEASDGGFIYLSENYDSFSINKTDENGQVTGNNDNILETNSLKLYNYPNPFNPETTICFSTTEVTENAEIEIYNIKGQQVKKLKIENGKCKIEEGKRSVVWDGTDFNGSQVSSGVYLYRLKGNNFISETSIMILLK